jgi:hypothetical protein
MAAEGLLLQLDGSRHNWLGPGRPKITLLGAIDDATGCVPAAVFRAEEDAAGYLELLRAVALGPGLPGAVYRDRHSCFEPTLPRGRGTGNEARSLSQVGRALVELGVVSIAAGSAQAKGRVERLWGTLQDRLLLELSLAGVVDVAGANEVLRAFLPDFNRRARVPRRTRSGLCRTAVASPGGQGATTPGGRRRSAVVDAQRATTRSPVPGSGAPCTLPAPSSDQA